MRFVPAVGLLLASPVLHQAVTGVRPLHEALLVWLVAMLLAAAGWWLWSAATRPPTYIPLEVVAVDDGPRRRRQDGEG
ncbi:hypothetical protein [Aquipuribacter sp. MA13-6]|uniref:hypothetical protein n=1 Tax=unclassified Aquipuribacter TaxID=2635084 RepID=UPI003EE95B6E